MKKKQEKYPRAKFKIGAKIIVDDLTLAVVADRGLFKKNGIVAWSYQLKDTPLAGFWAKEDRIKLTR